MFCASDSLQYCARKVLNVPLQSLLETGNESAHSQALTVHGSFKSILGKDQKVHGKSSLGH